jgi:YfiH family protein
MDWRWTLENGTYVLRPRPLPPGLAEAGFVGRRLTPDGKSPIDGRPLVRLEQIHSATVTRADEPGVFPACDAVISAAPGLTLTVRTADCLPAVLVSSSHGIALVHAGWRGLAAGILERATRGFPDPAALTALLGPAIGPCCFEVGPEVAAAFPHALRRPPRSAKAHVDLVGAARTRLAGAGVPEESIHASGICTRCHQHLLHSHRGSGGDRGRLVAFAAAEPPLPVHSA